MFGIKPSNGSDPSPKLSGMAGMLRNALGEKTFADLEAFGTFIGDLKGELERLHARADRIEAALARIEQALGVAGTEPEPVTKETADG